MSRFLSAMKYGVQTWNGATSLSTPDPSGMSSGRMGLFFKSVRGLDALTLYEYLRESAQENILDTFLLVFHIRDCRGGKGERELGRLGMVWLFLNYPDEFENVMGLLPEYGRWDDLFVIFPSVLDLSNRVWVCKTHSSDIKNEKAMERLRSLQYKAVGLLTSKLRQDKNAMLEGNAVSLAAKWCVTEYDSLDKKTGVYQVICDEMKVSPRTLRKTFITPLRAYLSLVEVYMCSNRWDEINLSKVPSCAMKKLKKAFEKHMGDQFTEWKNALASGDPSVKVNAKQLFPHELIREVRTTGYADEVCEAQWKVIEGKVKSNGSFSKSVVVVDTSSSMHSPDYIPFDNAVALGLLISSNTEGEFKDIAFTFNTNPECVKLDSTATLTDRYRELAHISWGGSTNLQATFRLLLDKAIAGELTQEDMPELLWILSDMQFNSISGYGDCTNFQAIDKMYAEAGYKRPNIVFWNLNGSSRDFSVTVGDHGTSLISGFSPSTMTAVLNGSDFSPLGIMRTTLDAERYDKVREALSV